MTIPELHQFINDNKFIVIFHSTEGTVYCANPTLSLNLEGSTIIEGVMLFLNSEKLSRHGQLVFDPSQYITSTDSLVFFTLIDRFLNSCKESSKPVSYNSLL